LTETKQIKNYKLIGSAGIAWSIIQVIAGCLFMCITTPAFQISQVIGLGASVSYLISAVVLV
jgi:hypothetical protein